MHGKSVCKSSARLDRKACCVADVRQGATLPPPAMPPALNSMKSAPLPVATTPACGSSGHRTRGNVPRMFRVRERIVPRPCRSVPLNSLSSRELRQSALPIADAAGRRSGLSCQGEEDLTANDTAIRAGTLARLDGDQMPDGTNPRNGKATDDHDEKSFCAKLFPAGGQLRSSAQGFRGKTFPKLSLRALLRRRLRSMVKNEQIGIAENAERGGPEVDRRRHFESNGSGKNEQGGSI